MFKKIGRSLAATNEKLERNRAATDERNAKVLRVLLVSAAGVFSISLISGFFFSELAYMRYTLLLIVLVSLGLYLLLRKNERKYGRAGVYIVYGILSAYATLTSSFVSNEYVCVTILAFQVLLPVLFIDKGWRINLAVLCGAAVYLGVVSWFKTPALLPDEIINVAGFTVLGCVVGAYLRDMQLDNLDMKQTLGTFAYTDQLTGLPNRRSFFELLAKAETKDASAPITAFAMIDIDSFKQYNDTYGHQSGDECLRRLGECLNEYHEKFQIDFCRYGGEEFVAADSHHNQSEFLDICEKMRKSVAKMRIQNADGSVASVTISIGVATLKDLLEKKYSTLLSNADKALYTAKQEGKNRVVRFADGDA